MLLQEKYKDYKIILASKSPRRQGLFKSLGLEFDIVVNEIEEVYPENLTDEEIGIYLAELKAYSFDFRNYPDRTLIITADTIVSLNNHILNKPKNIEDAARMLRMLSGRMHRVITGICLKTMDKTRAFADITEVYFKELTNEEIAYYLENYKPLDKAGAYGAQEWIGYVGIDTILGSYFNVVGLPMHRLYEEMMKF
jgi:septum formation protein